MSSKRRRGFVAARQDFLRDEPVLLDTEFLSSYPLSTRFDMAYLLNLFTPETWEVFRQAGAKVSGFRQRQQRLAGKRVTQGDVFLCYLVRLSRWCGALEVRSEVYEDHSPIYSDPDPFPIRFRVMPIVVLEPELAVPIHDETVWETLSITNQYDRSYPYWSGFFRSSLNKIDDSDGGYLLDLLKAQQTHPKAYPFTEKDLRQLSLRRKIRTLERDVEVEIPGDEIEASGDTKGGHPTDIATLEAIPGPDGRKSIRMQAKVAQIGAEMGFYIWVPRNDRANVLQHIRNGLHGQFLNQLPLNYDDNTLHTIEHIDVLWLKGRSISRGFEIEHTTAIYSGLLRMADLLALQPNINISLHIVAPMSKREKVLCQIMRPVFSLLDYGPLSEKCSFLSYDAIETLGKMPHLSHTSETILEEYEEYAGV